MKQLIEGNELLRTVPSYCSKGKAPIVKLENNLILDDTILESPTAIIGGVGTGKSTLLTTMLDQIAGYAEKVDDNIVIFCAKPTFLHRYVREGDPVIQIRSDDPASCWNIFCELAASDDPELTIREISRSLFAEQRERANNVFFPDAAADCFRAVLHFMHDSGYASLSNAKLINLLKSQPIFGEDSWMQAAERYPEYFGMMRDYLGEGSEQGFAILSELRTLIANTVYGSFANDRGTFSAIDTLKRDKSGGNRVFLYFDYAEGGYSALPLFKIILELLIKQSLSAKMKHKTWFVLDEFSLLPGMMDILSSALSIGRDPGDSGMGGFRIIVALQSMKLLQKNYSRDQAEILLSLFQNLISFRVMDSFSREVLSDRYGEARYHYRYEGLNGNYNEMDSCEKVISDYCFSYINKKGQALMSLPGISDHPFIYDGYREEFDK